MDEEPKDGESEIAAKEIREKINPNLIKPP